MTAPVPVDIHARLLYSQKREEAMRLYLYLVRNGYDEDAREIKRQYGF